MVKKRLGYAVRMMLFVLIVAFFWRMLENVLRKQGADTWRSDAFSNIYKEKDYYDVLFSGTSMVIGNVNMEELYISYGIAGAMIGQPRQPTYLSYYAVEEALKYQKPKAVIFDVKSLFYTRDYIIENVKKTTEFAQVTLESMKNSRTKYEAYLETKKFDSSADFWDYFSPMYYRHSNWEALKEWNFTHENTSDWMLGNRMRLNISSKKRTKGPEDVENTGEATEIPACNMRYLIKMIELCAKKDVDLILISGNGILDWNWNRYNAVKSIADEYNLPYLDINFCDEAIGLNWSTDLSDGVHLNMSGAKKWTDYIGGYLAEKYEIPDRRLDECYSGFEDNVETYEDRLTVMNTKIELNKAKDFGQYMPKLLAMDKEDYTIFIAVSDDATYRLGPKRKKDFQTLGLTKSLEDKFRYSYLAVIDDGVVTQEKLSRAKVTAEGTLSNGVKYELCSGGNYSGVSASLLLDGTQKLKNERGINIVVYNKKIGEVISSVYFDTCADKNPKTGK